MVGTFQWQYKMDSTVLKVTLIVLLFITEMRKQKYCYCYYYYWYKYDCKYYYIKNRDYSTSNNILIERDKTVYQ